LALLSRREEEKRVIFLHVPTASDDVAIRTGVDVTLELIRAIIQSERMRKVLKQGTVDSKDRS